MAYTNIKKSSDYFNTKLWTGNGGTQSITGVGFQPDFTWIKSRSAGSWHHMGDVVRGADKRLQTNSTNAESTVTTGITSWDSDGFSLGSSGDSNASSETFASWNWLADNTSGVANTDGSISSTVSANTTSGFSIVSWTGTGANATVGHGLGVAPKVVIVKNRTDATNWHTYHGAISGMSGGYITLNNADGFLTDVTTIWNGDHSSTVVDLGSNNNSNGSSDNMIAYCFAEKQGFSKFGSYTGNGNADGTFVYTGFKPAMVIVKDISGSNNWRMFDNKRNEFNLTDKFLFPSSNIAENTTSGSFDLVSNGFKGRSSNGGMNTSGRTYIYMAFASEPLVGDNPATAR